MSSTIFVDARLCLSNDENQNFLKYDHLTAAWKLCSTCKTFLNTKIETTSTAWPEVYLQVLLSEIYFVCLKILRLDGYY